jgi:hypothetical protein
MHISAVNPRCVPVAVAAELDRAAWQLKDHIMDIYRTGGIIAGIFGIILLAFAWQNAPAVLGPLDVTIGGYARNTVLLISGGVLALIAGVASYMMAKPVI